jgi:hypothetical protein
MQKVINGLLYDTESSACLATWSNMAEPTDPKRQSVWLWRSPNGHYFLEGEGGALTEWAVAEGSVSRAGAGLRALTDDEAFVWASTHLDGLSTQEVFPDLVKPA